MDTSRYFGGVGVRDCVRTLGPSDFPSFVKELLGHPTVFNCTRDQYHTMEKDGREAHKKRLPFVTPAVFKKENCDRVYENAASVSLIALDIDDSHQAAPFFHDPQRLATALEPLAFAAYTSATSTVEKPRLRVFVAAALADPTDYRAAVRTVAAMLGLPSVTRESLVVVQPMFLPSIFRDDDPETVNPLLIAVTDGETFRERDLRDDNGELPDTARKGKSDTPGSVDDLEFLRPTSDDVSMDDVRGALNCLDPDMVYNEWLEVAASLRHQFPVGEDAEEAYALFDEWSSKGQKYSGEEETQAKWKSLKATPKGRAPLTIRSLLHRAQEHGWDKAAQVATRCYENVMAWLSDPKRTDSELLSQAAKRIAATPLISHLERGTLLSRLQDVLKSRKLKVNRADLRREMASAERELRGKDADATNLKATPENQLPPWARGLCYVSGANEFYHRASTRAHVPDVLDKVYSVFLMGGEAEAGKPSVRPQDFLLNVAKIPRVDNYRYDPAHGTEVFVRDGQKRFVNIYIPTHPEPEKSEEREAEEEIMEHFHNLLSDEREVMLLTDYLAFQVQNPGVKIRWATLLQGAEGCGKTFVLDIMRTAIGREHVRSIDAGALLNGNYNEWATGAQLIGLEEVRVAGHNRYEVMNKLKPCISNDFISITQRYKDTRQVPNNANFLLLTNHHDSLALQDGDRRYFVLHSRLQTRDQVLALGHGYFKKKFDMLERIPGGVRAFFENWKLSKEFNPQGHAPATVHRRALIEAGASPIAAAVRNAIQDAPHLLVASDLVSLRHLRDAVEDEKVGVVSDQTLASVMRETGYRHVGRCRAGEARLNLWVPGLSPISDENAFALARERFTKALAADLG